jgi:hypothetical protein
MGATAPLRRFSKENAMAINDNFVSGSDIPLPPDAANAIATPYARRPLFPAIRWGAVLAGVAVGVSVQFVLTLLGIATGLSTADVAQGEGVGMGPLLWAGLSMLIGAFVGGYVAARMSGLKRKADGVLHGAVSWAVTTLLFATLATSVGGTLLGSVFSGMGQMAKTSASAPGGSPLSALMRAQGINLNADSLRQLQQYLQAGQREEAIGVITTQSGIDQNKASTLVDQALILSGSPQAASPQGRQTAENAVQGAGAAAWVVFIAVALALALGVGGGAVGAAGSRRVNWANQPVPQT